MARRAAWLFAMELVLCLSFLVRPVYSQDEIRELRSYTLPCEPDSLAVAADGTTAWIACEEAGKGSLESAWMHRNWVYALNLESGRVKKIAQGHGGVVFFAALRRS
jgi:hypothetical protein